jgi:hypothetical protein
MTIRANIEARKAQMLKEVQDSGTNGGEFSKLIKERAINAIMGGAADWVAYMSLFAQTPDELARLIPTDGTDADADKREARAYLVANAICAPGTATGLVENVFNRLDPPAVAAPAVVAPAVAPAVTAPAVAPALAETAGAE